MCCERERERESGRGKVFQSSDEREEGWSGSEVAARVKEEG